VGWTECGGERECHELDDDVKILALWKQHDSLSSTKTGENVTEEKLQYLLGECGWSLTGKEGKAKNGSTRLDEG
jgi:hypothetical protein